MGAGGKSCGAEAGGVTLRDTSLSLDGAGGAGYVPYHDDDTTPTPEL